MGGNGETFVGESRGENLLFGIDEDIVDLPALLADEMFVPFHHRVKVLGASQGQHLEFFLSHQFLKSPQVMVKVIRTHSRSKAIG